MRADGAARVLPPIALILEATAFAFLPLSWGAFLLLHVCGAGILAGAVFVRLPVPYRAPPMAVLALFFTLSFFVPLLGAAALWAAVEMASRLPAPENGVGLALLRAPEQAQPSGPREGSYGHGAIRPLLANPAAPGPRRLKALLALEHVPAKRASELLRRVLNDVDEEIRLVAHGILDKREKGVQEAISLAQAQLAEAHGPARLPALRSLAQLQWELIYGELAVGDVRAHLVASTFALVQEALSLAPGEPGLWYMQGRLALERGDDDAAERCFEEALRCGLPRGRALPWMAEIAFHARRFGRVRECMRELSGTPLDSAVGLSVRYWRGEEG